MVVEILVPAHIRKNLSKSSEASTTHKSQGRADVLHRLVEKATALWK